MEVLLALTTFLLTLILIILRPSSMGSIAVGGALLSLAFGLISLKDILYITGIVWDATLTFVLLIFISITLDKAGFFEWMALKAIGYARGNGPLLFVALMLLGAFISAVFANDGASLMLTPIVYSKIKHLRLPKTTIIPYVMGSGFIADTTSLPLVISNLTNIITAHFFGIDFWRYALLMFLPSVVAFLSSLSVLYLFYRKDMIKRYDPELLEEISPKYVVRDPIVFKVGWLVIILMGISFLVLELLRVKVPFSLVLGSFVLLVSLSSLKNKVVDMREVIRFAPWNVVSFSVGMYAVVYGLKNAGIVEVLERLIAFASELGEFYAILGVGLISAILSAILNNLPTVMVMNIALKGVGLSQDITEFLALANLVGTNIGPKLTPIGSLATLLWLHVLEGKGIRISWGYYTKVGFLLTFPVLLATLLTLYLLRLTLKLSGF